jgi:hypothetical protein
MEKPLLDGDIIFDPLDAIDRTDDLLRFLGLGEGIHKAAQLHHAFERLYTHLQTADVIVSEKCRFDFSRNGAIIDVFTGT